MLYITVSSHINENVTLLVLRFGSTHITELYIASKNLMINSVSLHFPVTNTHTYAHT